MQFATPCQSPGIQSWSIQSRGLKQKSGCKPALLLWQLVLGIPAQILEPLQENCAALKIAVPFGPNGRFQHHVCGIGKDMWHELLSRAMHLAVQESPSAASPYPEDCRYYIRIFPWGWSFLYEAGQKDGAKTSDIGLSPCPCQMPVILA